MNRYSVLLDSPEGSIRINFETEKEFHEFKESVRRSLLQVALDKYHEDDENRITLQSLVDNDEQYRKFRAIMEVKEGCKISFYDIPTIEFDMWGEISDPCTTGEGDFCDLKETKDLKEKFWEVINLEWSEHK